MTAQQLGGQLLLGLINGAFYAILSLGLAIVFGLLGIVNFAHGAFYMLGAMIAWLALEHFGIGYWASLAIAPLIVGSFAVVVEVALLRRIYKLDSMYGLLLTLGLSLILEGLFRQQHGTAGQPYEMPEVLLGAQDLGFMFLPNYRLWVICASVIVCGAALATIEKTKLGMYLRAATENPAISRAFGIHVTRLVTMTFGFGAGLAALGGVLAAPIYQVSPLMGANIIIVVFAVVVIGGMGSIKGAIAAGFGLGIIEGLTKVFYPAASATVIFVVMAIVLLLKPVGLFGVAAIAPQAVAASAHWPSRDAERWQLTVGAVLLVFMAAAPLLGIYPGFMMKGMCFALFACAFNLLIGYVGLLPFGHAAFFGLASYFTGYTMKFWGLTPELGIAVGIATGAVLGYVFGNLAIRRQGIYFAMITLALSQMVYFFCVQASFTGGEDGLQQIPRGYLFGSIDLNHPLSLYYFVLGVFLLGFLMLYRTIHSPFGQILRAIRDNEPRAISLGYKTARCKLIAFVISAAVTGMAGSTQALAFRIAGLGDVHWSTSGEVVLMTLVGGVGTIIGPIVGAMTLTWMSGYLAFLGAWVTVIQGVIFIACVLAFRRGIYGAVEAMVAGGLSRVASRPAAVPQRVPE